MPIYEFRCQKCRAEFEVVVTSVSAASEVVCKKCGAGEVVKQVSTLAGRVSSGAEARPAGALSGCSAKGGFS